MVLKKQRIHDGHGYFNFLNKFNVLDCSARFFFRVAKRLEHSSSYRGQNY